MLLANGHLNAVDYHYLWSTSFADRPHTYVTLPGLITPRSMLRKGLNDWFWSRVARPNPLLRETISVCHGKKIISQLYRR